MATLTELLISAEIDPADFAEDVRFIAQDTLKGNAVYLYSGEPSKWENHYSRSSHANYVDFPNGDQEILLIKLASDWETPLSIESYTAAWNAAHNVNVKEEENVMCEDVEFPVKMEYIGDGIGSFVVLFTDYTKGEVISSQNEFRPVGKWDNMWIPYNVSTAWKPYVEEDKAKWPKLMQSLYSGQVVEFIGQNSGTVIVEGKNEHNCCVGSFSDSWLSCYDLDTWKHYIEATQSPSAALPDIPATLTAQDIVKRLEELKMGMDSISKDIGLMQVELSHQKLEYAELRDTLLTLI